MEGGKKGERMVRDGGGGGIWRRDGEGRRERKE